MRPAELSLWIHAFRCRDIDGISIRLTVPVCRFRVDRGHNSDRHVGIPFEFGPSDAERVLGNDFNRRLGRSD